MTKKPSFFPNLLVIFLFAFSLLPRMAQALETTTKPVVLTVSGMIEQASKGKSATFDMPMLEKLPQHTLTVTLPWYTGPQTFTGPLLRDVLKAAGAKGKRITAKALNDYATEIPFKDATDYDVIVAHLLNGKPMSVRELGPLFVMYPFGDKPELSSDTYRARCAWQLYKIHVD